MPVLFEDLNFRKNLLPFTFTRHIADIRVGIMTVKEKWEHELGQLCHLQTDIDYLSSKYPAHESELFINASVLPTEALAKQISSMKVDSTLKYGGVLVAIRHSSKQPIGLDSINNYSIEEHKADLSVIENRWDIFQLNDKQIELDYSRVTQGRRSSDISSSNTLIGGRDNVFIEEDAIVEGAFLNPGSGKIYIGRNSVVMEGSCLRGSVALCDNSTLKMGSKIYGASTFGPHVKCGGEVNNSVMFGYSNKAHDGFLGNSVIGEWCNLGADTNVSNLKNNYSSIKTWSYSDESFESSGLQFCGLSMGDHSKCGINTMFNTGTVVGVAANIFGGDFPPKFIPSFSWGGSSGLKEYRLEEAIKVAGIVMERRSLKLSETDKKILEDLFNLTKRYRKI